MVSGERSARKASREASTTVKQQPFTAILWPGRSGRASGASGVSNAISILPPASEGRRRPKRPSDSTIPVNIAQVSFHDQIGAGAFDTEARQLRERLLVARCGPRQRHRPPAEHARSVKQDELVDKPAFEQSAIDSRPGLDQHAEDSLAPECGQNFG